MSYSISFLILQTLADVIRCDRQHRASPYKHSPHCAFVCFFTYALVHGEAMVDAGWQGDQVPLVHGDADPSVLLVPDVKVGLAIQDVADLVVHVQVLREEHLQLKDTDDISPRLIHSSSVSSARATFQVKVFKWN